MDYFNGCNYCSTSVLLVMDAKTAWFHVFHYRLKDIHFNDLDEHMGSAAARADKLLEAFEKRFPPHLPDDVLLKQYDFIEVAGYDHRYIAYLGNMPERDKIYVIEDKEGKIYFEYIRHGYAEICSTIQKAEIQAIKYYLDNVKGK